MTFDGTPMGVTHRLGTGNLIFVSGGLHTGIMGDVDFLVFFNILVDKFICQTMQIIMGKSVPHGP